MGDSHAMRIVLTCVEPRAAAVGEDRGKPLGCRASLFVQPCTCGLAAGGARIVGAGRGVMASRVFYLGRRLTTDMPMLANCSRRLPSRKPELSGSF